MLEKPNEERNFWPVTFEGRLLTAFEKPTEEQLKCEHEFEPVAFADGGPSIMQCEKCQLEIADWSPEEMRSYEKR